MGSTLNQLPTLKLRSIATRVLYVTSCSRKSTMYCNGSVSSGREETELEREPMSSDLLVFFFFEARRIFLSELRCYLYCSEKMGYEMWNVKVK